MAATFSTKAAGLLIDRRNQVWCADVNFIPMRRGFLDLLAIIRRGRTTLPDRRRAGSDGLARQVISGGP